MPNPMANQMENVVWVNIFSLNYIKPSFLRHAYMFKLDLPDVSVLKNKKIWVWDKVNNLLCKDWDYEKLL